jgi:DivIVA domain-containing protein
MWFFAVLLVLAMGGVALLAAGKGTPLAEVYDDRPDALVPAEGPLTGADLRRVRFSIALRGYRMSEVDALLDRLATEREQSEPWGGPSGGPWGGPSGVHGGEPTP